MKSHWTVLIPCKLETLINYDNLRDVAVTIGVSLKRYMESFDQLDCQRWANKNLVLKVEFTLKENIDDSENESESENKRTT